MAVSKVYFKCNDSWYVQVDGLALCASLVVILAKLWLKENEFGIKQEILYIEFLGVHLTGSSLIRYIK